jgi:hypothetical protein
MLHIYSGRSGLYVQSCVKPTELPDRFGDSCSDRGGIRAVSLNGNSATADILNRSRCLARCHLRRRSAELWGYRLLSVQAIRHRHANFSLSIPRYDPSLPLDGF